MSKKFDVVAVTGTYTDREGKEKNRYMTVGAIIDTKKGPMLKLEAVPLGWNGWAYLNDPKPREDKPAAKPAEEFSDEIPFD